MSEKLLYGVAYYYEYLPVDRMEEDFRMMNQAGINVIRIAESTWSTWEPKDGFFDFTYLHRVLKASLKHGLSVIIGTPTYAIPAWLAAKCPDILCETHRGTNRYGARQNFDITHPGYLFHAERIIRRLMEEVKDYPHIIGFQLDNETKAYDTCCPRVQKMFFEKLKERFQTVEALNQAFGLAYWSNSIASWDDLPDVRGTINGSYGAAFHAFQRQLVTDFLLWQRGIVDEYRRPDQFVTHNFDFEWRGYSFGVQPDVNHFDAAQALTIAGCDIYHPTEKDLTGAEIAFCGNLTRSLKQDNYFVLETEAQGNFGWLPYPGQLRLQAFSHVASGADGVSYWHWHSIHNSFESYWKGLLSHDFSEGAVYQEACTIGADFTRIGSHVMHLKKKNRVAIIVGNTALTALNWFPCCSAFERPNHTYNDYVRWMADALYRLNVEYDVISDQTRDFSSYDVLLIPALYAVPDGLAEAVTH
jgi:beta-galactosidase